jgi:hypothetical protein
MLRSSVQTALAVSLLACGGRSGLDVLRDADVPDDGSVVDAALDVSLPPDCATPGGVRICGGSLDCPWLTAPTCAGQGCLPSGEPDAGACFTDLPDKGDQPCSACSDGQVCVYRGSALVCAPQDLCETLWADGDELACRYSDKSAYTNAPLPTPSGTCPGNLGGGGPHMPFLVCGGSCGDCGAFPTPPCVGRSPGRPFGLCPELVGVSETPSVCSVMNGSGSGCPWTGIPNSCAVFRDAIADEPVAEQYGFCLTTSNCSAAAAVLPGGLLCFQD